MDSHKNNYFIKDSYTPNLDSENQLNYIPLVKCDVRVVAAHCSRLPGESVTVV